MASGAVVVVDSVVVVLGSAGGVVTVTSGGVTVTSVGAAAGAGASVFCVQADRLAATTAAARMALYFMWVPRRLILRWLNPADGIWLQLLDRR